MSDDTPVAGGPPPVTVRGLQRRFGDKVALHHIDLDVRQREIVGFVGPNGAGKTTCLRTLVGGIERHGGRAAVYGLDCQRQSLAVRRRLSYLPGETAVYEHLRGDEFLGFALHFYPRHDHELLALLRDAWPLPWARKVRTYSAGMKQKLALIACLVPDVGLYLLDEPDRALDATARLFLRDVLRRLPGAGKSVLLSSHHLSEVEALADRLVFVLDGRTLDDARVEATRHDLRQWLRLRLTKGHTPPATGALEVVVEADGSFRVRADGDPLDYARQIDRQHLRTVEFGVTPLEDLYRALAASAQQEPSA